jgi:hypothetical protein
VRHMEDDSWGLTRLRQCLDRLKVALGSLRPSPDADERTRGTCLTCGGTGLWYEGTSQEESCESCGGSGYHRP